MLRISDGAGHFVLGGMEPVLCFIMCPLSCYVLFIMMPTVNAKALSQSLDKAWPRKARRPGLTSLFLPQEQGLKANDSKELSMCFTEVSRGKAGRGMGAGDRPAQSPRVGCFLGDPCAPRPCIQLCRQGQLSFWSHLGLSRHHSAGVAWAVQRVHS